MEKQKVLIVSSSFYPTNSPRAFRTTELVKEFAKEGHEVTLLTLKNEEVHSSFEKEYGVTIKDLGPLYLPNLGNYGKRRITQRVSWIIHRILKHLIEYPDIELAQRVKKSLKDQKGYDLLISVAVPHPIHWGVAFARSEKHRIADTWVADCGDPYMGFKMDRFNKPFYFKYLEKKFCRRADFISVPLEEAKEAYYSEFRDKITVIPQGFNFDEIDINPSESEHYTGPVFGYAGNLLGGGRNPNELLDYLVDQQNKPFKFVIYTRNAGPIQPYLDRVNGEIDIRDYIPRDELLNKLAGMDFLVNLENDTARQAPSKLIDYYLTGRPVLSVPSQGLNTQKVQRFLAGDYSEKYNFKNMDKYRIEHVCHQFLKLCRKN